MLRFRIPASTLMTLLLLQAVALLLYMNWNIFLTPNTSEVPSSSGGKVHVLLLSSWRSGSSFLGQVFNRHPSVFYLMEPAWHVWSWIHRPGARSLRMAVRDLMHRFFLCDMSVMDAYMQPHYNVSHLFMWSHSRALCSPPVCLKAQDRAMEQVECEKHCKTAEFKQAELACQAHSHIVLKEVRFFELESLYPLLRDPSLDLRIVHLVRDPRAVFRSRLRSSKALGRDSALVLETERNLPDDAQRRVMQEVCRSHIRIYDTAMHKPPDFLQGRYKLVRYEDVVRDPLEEIRHIYDFVGLEMTEQLMEWIYRVTHGTGNGKAREAFKITERNAIDVAQAWRTSLPFDSVKEVQNVCRSAMSLLGYEMVNDEDEQKQLQLDLTRKQKYSFTWESSSSNSAISKL